mgnify:CR=1 FL=1
MTMLLLNVFGGLAIFIFGMKMMSDGLHKAAGERMQSVLRFFASNRFVAILSGALVTAVIQSSSASTVMVIGFVNAGLLNLMQSIGIIFGANIGTTITAQLVALKIEWIIMPAIIIGLLTGFINKPWIRGWSETIIGFGFLFLGMNLMSVELKALSSNADFVATFSAFNCAPVDGSMPFGPVLGAIGIGLLATTVIQSSSACTGIIIALGAGGIINLYTAVALTLGSNIGTTVTAQLAAIPANRIAKQAALAHTLFNVIGVLAITSTFWLKTGSAEVPVFFQVVDWLSADGDLPRRIANAHTLFNCLTALLLVPFIPALARICEKLIPLPSREVNYQFLEPHLLSTPSIALEQARMALESMFGKAWNMIHCSIRGHFMAECNDPADLRQLGEDEEQVDRLQYEITEYLTRLTCAGLTPQQAEVVPLIIHCVNDAERIGDHTQSVLELAGRLEAAKGKLSGTAHHELNELFSLLNGQADAAAAALRTGSRGEADRAGELEKSIILLAAQFEANHISRLGNSECSSLIGISYVEMLSEFRDISRHITNIAERSACINIQKAR